MNEINRLSYYKERWRINKNVSFSLSQSICLCVSFADVSMPFSCAPPQREVPASKIPPKSPELIGQCGVPTGRMWPSLWLPPSTLLSVLHTAGIKVPQRMARPLPLQDRRPTDRSCLSWHITMAEVVQPNKHHQTPTNTQKIAKIQRNRWRTVNGAEEQKTCAVKWILKQKDVTVQLQWQGWICCCLLSVQNVISVGSLSLSLSLWNKTWTYLQKAHEASWRVFLNIHE